MWISYPHTEFAREIEDVQQIAARANAWRTFLSSATADALRKIKGHGIWFSRHEHFERLIAEFDCSEKSLRKTISTLLRPEHRDAAYEFKRKDIYDSRGWAQLPLNWFVAGLEEFQPRTTWGRQRGEEVLKGREVPIIQFGITLPWTIDRSCFKMTYRLKDGQKFAVMTFSHPDLDHRFGDKRWVAEEAFPRDTDRDEMEDTLFGKVEAVCAQHRVTIEN